VTTPASVLYKWLPIRQRSDFRRLAELLAAGYAPAEVADLLERHVSAQCAGVLIEFAYVDKDYRSTYYHFYAKKGLRYDSFCVRLHFFDGDIGFRDETLELTATRGDLAGHYMGFMVLRPTWVATIGRTVVSTWLMDGFQGRMIGTLHKVHLLGNSLDVWGFPWMYQHRDITVCAHVACWAILRHYSERYGTYAERLTHDVTRMAYDFDPGGLVPSLGLTVFHAERVFAAAGTYPILVLPHSHDDGAFYRHLLAYVESGFPLFAALPTKRHAIAVIGHGPVRDTRNPGDDPKPVYYSADFTDELIVIDDNFAPYRSIGRTPRDVPYGIDAIRGFIVPLPDKVHYPAEAVGEFALDLTGSGYYGIGIAPHETPVIRYFLTTTAAFTRFMASNRSQFAHPVLATALQLPLPQFLWIIEVATEEQWSRHHVSFRAVLDATASLTDNNPLFLIHDEKRLVVINRAGSGSPLQLDFPAIRGIPLARMPGSLEQSKPLLPSSSSGSPHA
jgi:hypothetical protein